MYKYLYKYKMSVVVLAGIKSSEMFKMTQSHLHCFSHANPAGLFILSLYSGVCQGNIQVNQRFVLIFISLGKHQCSFLHTPQSGLFCTFVILMLFVSLS